MTSQDLAVRDERTAGSGPMTAEEARVSVDEAKGSLVNAAACVVEQIEREAWLALGYESWDDMREGEYGGIAVMLPSVERHELVISLRALGLTQQQIADTVGVSEGAVRLDLNRSSTNQPATITNARGQERPTRYQQRQAEPPEEAEQGDDGEFKVTDLKTAWKYERPTDEVVALKYEDNACVIDPSYGRHELNDTLSGCHRLIRGWFTVDPQTHLLDVIEEWLAKEARALSRARRQIEKQGGGET